MVAKHDSALPSPRPARAQRGAILPHGYLTCPRLETQGRRGLTLSLIALTLRVRLWRRLDAQDGVVRRRQPPEGRCRQDETLRTAGIGRSRVSGRGCAPEYEESEDGDCNEAAQGHVFSRSESVGVKDLASQHPARTLEASASELSRPAPDRPLTAEARGHEVTGPTGSDHRDRLVLRPWPMVGAPHDRRRQGDAAARYPLAVRRPPPPYRTDAFGCPR
jgi:hypothetical protein